MPEHTILAVDPDQVVLSCLRRSFVEAGCEFYGARRGEDALHRARMARPDGVVARVNLPDMGVREFVGRLRLEMQVPVLLTAQEGQEKEIAAGLEVGASNFIFFPFEDRELTFRVRGLFRWTGVSHDGSIVRLGSATVDLEMGEVVWPEKWALTRSEMKILRLLLEGRAVTHRNVPVKAGSVLEAEFESLRSKLGEAGDFIERVDGVGCRFSLAACA